MAIRDKIDEDALLKQPEEETLALGLDRGRQTAGELSRNEKI